MLNGKFVPQKILPVAFFVFGMLDVLMSYYALGILPAGLFSERNPWQYFITHCGLLFGFLGLHVVLISLGTLLFSYFTHRFWRNTLLSFLLVKIPSIFLVLVGAVTVLRHFYVFHSAFIQLAMHYLACPLR